MPIEFVLLEEWSGCGMGMLDVRSLLIEFWARNRPLLCYYNLDSWGWNPLPRLP